MNIQTNPWSFSASDILTATPSASPTGLVYSASTNTVALTTGGAHGLAQNDFVTVFGATNSAYNGFYRVIAVPTATTATLHPNFPIAAATAASGGGTIAKDQYPYQVRIEDISWQNAASAGDTLVIRDRNGLPLWEATAVAAGTQNRGKLFWCSGFVITQMSSGIVIVTIN